MVDLSAQELVGYTASALVVLSLAMTSVVRLRVISLVGSVVFIAYAVLIDAVPIIVTNVAIAVINVWFLRAELGLRRDLGASVIPSDTPFLADFVAYHLDDIHRFQPTFELPTAPDAFAVLLLRDGLPAGALIGHQHGSRLEIELDYVLKAYRDSKLGGWLFGPGAKVFRGAGIEQIVTRPGNELHRAYLERIGFRRDGEQYVRTVGDRSPGRGDRERPGADPVA